MTMSKVLLLNLGTLPGNDLVFMQSSQQGGLAAGIDGVGALSPTWLQEGRQNASRGNEEGLSLSMVVTLRGESISILQSMEEIK